jgi:predicted flap endonuclease-1-like 5' DNA nuclease
VNKKYFKILVLIVIWAAVTWRFRDHLLPLPKPDKAPAPHFRTPEPQARPDHLTAVRTPAPAEEPAPVETPAAPPSPEPPRPTLVSAPEAATDDLTLIKGIGPAYSGRLADIGITTFAGLAAGNASTIAPKVDVPDALVADWIRQAAGLVD